MQGVLRLAGLAALLILAAGAAAADEVPRFTIARASGSIKIDGDLTDIGWQGATRVDTWYETNPGDNVPAKIGNLGIRIGLGWAKSHSFTTGQCPVKRYNRDLMMAILHDKIKIAKAVNVSVISLDDAPKGYKDFDKGAAKKYVIDPHGMIAA